MPIPFTGKLVVVVVFYPGCKNKNLLYRAGALSYPPAVKTPTLADCEKKYEAADKAYRAYLDKAIKLKFKEYKIAARAVQRSRAHLFDCVAGKRGLDSVRRLVGKVEAAKLPE